jgi:DNA excision repair protein ERCC-2
MSLASDTDKTDRRRTRTVTWQEVFGHSEPYPEQADGIETVIETARNDGYTVLEGACGTGKTMLALTAGIHLVRDPESSFERVLVLTSVKQQLRQFEEDVRTINENLPEDWRPVSGLTLVGKADVCPYSRERAGDVDPPTVYERCEGLRERTRNLTGEGGATTAGALVSDAGSAQTGLADTSSGGPRHLETAGESTPYLPETPSYGDTEYCPFYAQFLADLPTDGDPIEAVPFEFEHRGLLDVTDLVGLSASHGTCPHSMMGALLPELEIVIGNYYHAFDPETVGGFTGALLDDSTLVVCDEAHMLEPRVRDLVSTGVGDASLRNAINELTRVIQPIAFEDGEQTRSRSTGANAGGRQSDDADLVRGELADSDLSIRDLRGTRAFLEDLREELDRRVRAHLDRTRPDWRADMTALEDQELPLRDPERPEPDEITEWALEAGHDESVWARAAAVGSFTAHVLDELEGEDRQRAAPAVGRAVGEWYRRDHQSYFREIELERTWNEDEPPDSWRRAYNARLALHNCVPGDAIAEQLGEFGGGVLMSATLEPLDVFREVTGLERLADDGRPVEQRTYGLSFPEDNRASFAVDVPKFTYGNRGAPPSGTIPDATAGRGGSNATASDAPDPETLQVRRAHVDAVATIARSPGNVLVGMPNYAEAEWMARELRQRIDKPVLLDEASDDETTESLKGDFFSGEGKVLVTSLRGTLTEGVDYRGDRLAAAAVCGVPLINTASPRTKAVRTAYDRRFGDGFETALLVPAVRKARQAIGRVIRGPEEVGVRALVDARYARDSWDSVREYVPPTEREEFSPVSSDMLEYGLSQFWERAGDGDRPEK